MDYSAELLINAVKEYRFLIDKHQPDFKNRAKKDRTWEEIGKLFGLTRKQADKKFKNLKDIYMRKKQKIKEKQKSGAGAADVPTIKWPHYEAMVEVMEASAQPALVLCSADEDDKSFTYAFDEAAGESSMQAVQETAEPLLDGSESDDEGQACEQECSLNRPGPSSEAPPAKRPRMLQKKNTENDRNANENMIQACLQHLAEIRERRATQQKDEIALFCMLLEQRLRTVPLHLAREVMHSFETQMFEVQALQYSHALLTLTDPC